MTSIEQAIAIALMESIEVLKVGLSDNDDQNEEFLASGDISDVYKDQIVLLKDKLDKEMNRLREETKSDSSFLLEVQKMLLYDIQTSEVSTDLLCNLSEIKEWTLSQKIPKSSQCSRLRVKR